MGLVIGIGIGAVAISRFGADPLLGLGIGIGFGLIFGGLSDDSQTQARYQLKLKRPTASRLAIRVRQRLGRGVSRRG